MNIIVAIDNNYGIGKNNDLLISIPEDMKFFRNMTTDCVVIMGKKTLESFPNGKPLKNRINIVISNDINYKVENAIIVHSINDAILEAKKYEKEIFIIGGASIYKQFINIVDTLYITKIEKDFGAEVFFPKINENEWIITPLSDIQYHNDIPYQFIKYKRK